MSEKRVQAQQPDGADIKEEKESAFASNNEQRRGDHKHNVAHVFCRCSYNSIHSLPPRYVFWPKSAYIDRSWNNVEFEQCEYGHWVGKRYRHKAAALEFPPKIFSSFVVDKFNAQKGKKRKSKHGWGQGK